MPDNTDYKTEGLPGPFHPDGSAYSQLKSAFDIESKTSKISSGVRENQSKAEAISRAVPRRKY